MMVAMALGERDRYVLRPLARGDAEVLASWSQDREFCRAAEWSPDRPLGEALAHFQRLIDSPPLELLRFGLIEGGVLVAFTDLHGLQDRRRELGFTVGDRSRWGRGLGRIAASLTLDHAFGSLGLQTVWAEAYEANTRSLRVLEHLGFHRTGAGAEGSYLGAPTAYVQFEITRWHWRSANG